jgi:hypothetical protein
MQADRRHGRPFQPEILVNSPSETGASVAWSCAVSHRDLSALRIGFRARYQSQPRPPPRRWPCGFVTPRNQPTRGTEPGRPQLDVTNKVEGAPVARQTGRPELWQGSSGVEPIRSEGDLYSVASAIRCCGDGRPTSIPRYPCLRPCSISPLRAIPLGASY